MSKLKEKYYSLTDIQTGKSGWGRGKYHHKLIKELGLKVWHRRSGTEASLTSQSRNHEPGSAKPMKEVCNGFMSKIIPSLLVCLWYWNFPARYMSTGMYVFPCIYTSVCMHYTIDYSFFIEQSEFCQLVLLVHKCFRVCPSKPSETILIRSITLILYLQKPAGNTYAPSTTSGLSALRVHPSPAINYERFQ